MLLTILHIYFFFRFSIDRWLVPPKPKTTQQSLARKLMSYKPYQLTKPYVKNNYVYLIFFALFVFINVALFVSRAVHYIEHNIYTILARACGKLLQSL